MTVSFLIGCWRKVSRRRKSFAAGFISTSPDCRRRPRNSTIFSTPHSALESLVHKLSEPTRITEEFDAYAPDLVITDIKMPEMDGIELVERLRSHLSRDTCLPILVLTGSPEPRHKRCARAVVTQYLKGDRHRVVIASDGGEALQRVMSEHFDLVTTDHGMPGMSGVQLADSVRRIALAKRVILLTGFAHGPAQQPASVNCVLKKTLVPDELRAAMQSLGKGVGERVPAAGDVLPSGV
jgi:CheY-like chemotaxis protein